MYRTLHLSTLSAGLLGLASIFAVGCSDPMPPSLVVVEPPPEKVAVEDCAASDEWLPNTPEFEAGLFRPLPHPKGECPFYRGAWQNFLLVTQPDQMTGEPAIKAMPTIDDVFLSYKPHATRGTKDRAWLGDVKQAGTRDILIDQNGHTLYYGIHVNDKFRKFVDGNGLKSPKAIQDANENLFFTEGVVELKSAWQQVDDNAPASELDTFIHTKAWVPTLSQDAQGNINEDKDHPRQITVRLLALHVVFTLPGHPEFIWGSFEHTAANGQRDIAATDGFRDVAPIHPTDENPDLNAYKTDDTLISSASLLLYKGGTKAREANFPIKPRDLMFDAATQSFPGQQTSIYRMFPASKSNTTKPDEAIATLNYNVQKLFEIHQKDLHPNDRRGHYRLVGAQWLDKPGYFGPESTFQNDKSSPLLKLSADQGGAGDDLPKFEANLAAEGGDSPYSLTAGEDRMSSMAMESFTQGPDSFPNCFSCHNTEAVTSKGVSRKRSDAAEDVTLVSPKLLNVSHVLSQVILEECTGAENVKLQGGFKVAVCPPIAGYDDQ